MVFTFSNRVSWLAVSMIYFLSRLALLGLPPFITCPRSSRGGCCFVPDYEGRPLCIARSVPDTLLLYSPAWDSTPLGIFLVDENSSKNFSAMPTMVFQSAKICAWITTGREFSLYECFIKGTNFPNRSCSSLTSLSSWRLFCPIASNFCFSKLSYCLNSSGFKQDGRNI